MKICPHEGWQVRGNKHSIRFAVNEPWDSQPHAFDFARLTQTGNKRGQISGEALRLVS